jgi:hypothetical protein
MKTTEVSKISSIFGEEARHLHGNLFRVKRDRIQLSKPGISCEDGLLVYGNPRWHTNNRGQQEARGMDKGGMEELKNSIQDEGLENPIRLRVVENGKKSFLQVINGERRFRCLEELCERNVPCFDCSMDEDRPASDIYEWIDCRIDFMDDKTALRVALKPNATSQMIGDAASIHVVKVLKESGFDDQEILKSTGKSISWLRETEKIIGLDEVCLQNFEQDKINRTVALHLALVENVDERLEMLQKIKDSAEIRHSEKMRKIEDKKAKNEREIECEDAAAHLAKKYGDDDSAEMHSKKSEKARNKAKAIEGEHNRASSRPGKATSKDLGVASPLSHNKIQSLYIDLIAAVIEGEGFDDDGNSYGLNLELLDPIAKILNAIMGGNKEAMAVLLEHCALVVAEEETEDEEMEDEETEDEETEDEEIESQIGDDEEEYEEEEDDEEDEDEEYEEEIIDEDDTPIELEREFEAAVNEEEDFD